MAADSATADAATIDTGLRDPCQPCGQAPVVPTAATTPTAPARADRDAPFVLAATILASAMVFIDGNVVNVALPTLQATFNADVTGLQWVVESYLVTLTALLLAGGALGDRLGRRRIFVAGIGVFALASVLCGIADSIDMLIAARALQGVGGALLVPGSLAIITAYFDADRRGRAIGTWSAYSAITVAIAPLIGGWLIEAVSWRWIFFVNVPLAIVAAAIALWRVPESRDEHACARGLGSIDWPGTALISVGLAGVVVALIEAPRLGFGAPIVWVSAAVGLAALAGFVAVEHRRRDPMLPLSLFADRTFAGTNVLTLLLYAALGGAMFMLPLHLISVRGYDALEAGAALLPFIALLSVLSRFTGSLADRCGARLLLTAGPAITACGFVLLALPGLEASYWVGYLPGITVMGLGMALTVAPLTTAVMNAVPADRSGIASGVNNAVSRFAWLIAVAALGGLAIGQFSTALSGLVGAEALMLGDEILKLGGASVPDGVAADVAARLEDAIPQAALASFRMILWVGAGLALLSAVVGYVTVGRRRTAAVAA